MLKVTQHVRSASGKVGSLEVEVVQNGPSQITTIRQSGGLLTGSAVVKHQFTGTLEMQELRDALNEAILFFTEAK